MSYTMGKGTIMASYTPDGTMIHKAQDDNMYVCTEIAAAESIPELNYEAPRADENKQK